VLEKKISEKRDKLAGNPHTLNTHIRLLDLTMTGLEIF